MCATSSQSFFKCSFFFFFYTALCNEDANGNVPLGKSCNRYWNCQGGYPRLQRCPAQLVFDKHSSRCVVPPTEDCDIQATPAPELEQGSDQVNFMLLFAFCYLNFFFFSQRNDIPNAQPSAPQQKNVGRPRN